MADLITTRLVCTAIAGASGAARLQLLGGSPTSGQWVIADMELTAAQNAALAVALAAAASTVTNFDFPGAPSVLPGISNAL